MALSITRFFRSTSSSIQSAVEVGGYLVEGDSVGTGEWAAYDLSTNTSRVFEGIQVGTNNRPSFVAYGGYAWTMQGSRLMRLNPVTGGVAQSIMTNGFSANQESVLNGSTLYTGYNTRRMISVDLSASPPTSTLIAADTGFAWSAPPVFGSDGAIWASSTTSPSGIYRFTTAGVATKIGNAPFASTNLIESGGYIYYGSGNHFYRINMATSDWEGFDTGSTFLTGRVALGSDGRIYGTSANANIFGGLDPATGLTQVVVPGFNLRYMLRRNNGDIWFISAEPDPWP